MWNFNQTPTHTVKKVKYIYLNLSFFFNLCHQHSNSGRVNLLLKRETSDFVIVFPGTSGTEGRLERQLPYFEALDRGWTDLPGNGSISLQGRGKGPQREFHSSNSQDSSFIWPRLFHRIELLQTTIWFLFITIKIGHLNFLTFCWTYCKYFYLQ